MKFRNLGIFLLSCCSLAAMESFAVPSPVQELLPDMGARMDHFCRRSRSLDLGEILYADFKDPYPLFVIPFKVASVANGRGCGQTRNVRCPGQSSSSYSMKFIMINPANGGVWYQERLLGTNNDSDLYPTLWHSNDKKGHPDPNKQPYPVLIQHADSKRVIKTREMKNKICNVFGRDVVNDLSPAILDYPRTGACVPAFYGAREDKTCYDIGTAGRCYDRPRTCTWDVNATQQEEIDMRPHFDRTSNGDSTSGAEFDRRPKVTFGEIITIE